MSTPLEVAEWLVTDAPDAEWLRTLVDALDRHLRTAPLKRLLMLWDISASEGARTFGISRRALEKRRQFGPPAECSPALADLVTATDLLDRHVKRERILAVVRRPAATLGNQSLYDLACGGRHVEVRTAVEAMFDLRRVQP